MFYEVAKRDHGLPHDPFKALVAPRPIGWISTASAKGEINLSPYSFFNAVSDQPPMVAFASQGRKDALTFIEETGEFVCNLATFELRDAVNETSAPLARGESEMTLAGLTPAPSRLVKPPRVAEAPAALECRHLQTVPLTPLSGAEARYFLVVGRSGRNPHRRAFHRGWPRRHGRDAADHAGRLPRLLRRHARHALRHDTPARRLGRGSLETKKAGVSRPLRHFACCACV